MVIIMIINFAAAARIELLAVAVVVFDNSSAGACARDLDPSHRSGTEEEFVVAVTANYMVLRSLPPVPPMINETASVIGYALNAEKAGGGMAREVKR